jgi:phage tail P2-like protein
MFDIQDHLLPETATPLAKAMDILEERLFALPVQMITKDPWSVDVSLLDHLAWEESVDVWDMDWPEDIKRNVIAIAAEVHRFKGSPFAVKRALEAFDVRTELLEWFDDPHSEGRGTFKVTAYAGRALYSDEEVFINEKMVHAIRSVVQRAAPVSRGFIMAVGVKFDLPTFRVAAGQTAIGDRKTRGAVEQHIPVLSMPHFRVVARNTNLGLTRLRMTIGQYAPQLPVEPATAGHTSAISATRAKVA